MTEERGRGKGQAWRGKHPGRDSENVALTISEMVTEHQSGLRSMPSDPS